MEKNIPHHRRAIIFQGGGALGAYEVGFYEALYEKFIKEKEFKDPFDVVVGTSIGAINGGLLVGYYQKNKTWEGSVQHMKDFWDYISSSTPISDTMSKMWYNWRKFFPNGPTEEESRRLFSVNEFLFRGVPNVFSVPKYRFDPEFYTLSSPWFQANNKALKESLEKFIDFPISTDYKKEDPRLLLVAADVQESLPVIFDSFQKPDGKRWSLYGERPAKDGKGSEGGYVIEYDGIEVEHIIASANVPLNYDYTKIMANEVIKFDRKNLKLIKGKESQRYFWDGAILHNTPVLPLIYHHKSFWDFHIGIEKQKEAILSGYESQETKIPELYAYVIDMWAKKSIEVPQNYNDTKSRLKEIMYSDKTEFEEHVVDIVDEYVVLVTELLKLAKDKGVQQDEIKKLLDVPINSRFYAGIKRKNIDLIRGKFRMKVMRIARRDDPDDIADQTFDFSPRSLDILIKEGYNDSKRALSQMDI